jgi:hypothetical protein
MKCCMPCSSAKSGPCIIEIGKVYIPCTGSRKTGKLLLNRCTITTICPGSSRPIQSQGRICGWSGHTHIDYSPGPCLCSSCPSASDSIPTMSLGSLKLTVSDWPKPSETSIKTASGNVKTFEANIIASVRGLPSTGQHRSPPCYASNDIFQR